MNPGRCIFLEFSLSYGFSIFSSESYQWVDNGSCLIYDMELNGWNGIIAHLTKLNG
ncbi:hypothetical protein OIU79_020407 [Salix purpurea]|uniref:Uncharacterized protein n=1 Tax=Salix purpurea TaxID=77065 RepID=A0A9Q0WLL4_SALPP|nr:hypothetical protein OIU79_020407 [Salix purpurea]